VVVLKVHVLSDLHLEFAPFVPPVTDADVVILAGDIGIAETGTRWAKNLIDAPVIYVPGNHEYYDPFFTMAEHKANMLHTIDGSNVTLMDNDVIIIGDVRFIGTTLWTDLQQGYCSILYSDAERIVTDANRVDLIHFSVDYAQELFDRNKVWLKSELAKPFDGKTVVVTHHAPSEKSIHAQYVGNPFNPCFVTNMEALMGSGVDLWGHGHTHNNFDYEVNGTQVICNPRGYPNVFGNWENMQFDPTLVVEV